MLKQGQTHLDPEGRKARASKAGKAMWARRREGIPPESISKAEHERLLKQHLDDHLVEADRLIASLQNDLQQAQDALKAKPAVVEHTTPQSPAISFRQTQRKAFLDAFNSAVGPYGNLQIKPDAAQAIRQIAERTLKD